MWKKAIRWQLVPRWRDCGCWTARGSTTPARPWFGPISARLKTRFRDLWSRIEGFWPALAQVLLLSVVLQVAVFAAPFYLQLTVDEAIQRGDAELLPVLAVGFGGLAVIQATVTALRSWTLQSIGCLLSFQLTGNIVHHLLRLPTGFFEKRHVGDILSRLGSVEPLRDALTGGWRRR